ncbi:MAG: hypothetical protein P1U68_01960 [Verrucomicrobiales bacterium]|nr:hypothetical protein [Verrucomicrobiales bacterium]
MKNGILTFIAGAFFGAGLALSGMTDPLKVTAFLDVFGFWDPTLAFVMGGALLVFTTGYFLLRGTLELPANPGEKISSNLVLGAILFGIGWGLGGFCPGPAIANFGALRSESFVFVPAMALGMILVQRIYRIDG